jgi:hypothetical protein
MSKCPENVNPDRAEIHRLCLKPILPKPIDDS